MSAQEADVKLVIMSKKEFTEKDFEIQSQKVTEEDGKKVLQQEDEILEKTKKVSILAKYLDEIKLLLSMLKDYFTGKYKAVPWNSISGIIFALLYLISPIDLIPDLFPGIGYIDDTAVIALCLKLISSDIEKYKFWKSKAS